MKSNMKIARVLTIAGSDSGGGAGIQADIKAISATGSYAASAITTVTVQNTVGVRDVFPLPINIVTGQIEAVLDDIGADAIKIGMLHSVEVIEAVRTELLKYRVKNLVIDPVMVATSGDRLINEDAVSALKERLLPLATVITPNIPEAEILLGRKLDRQKELASAAEELSAALTSLASAQGFDNKVSVLLKAGHLTEERLVDIFYNAQTGETLHLDSRRINTRNTHGTGCTMSSAFASFLARGFSLNDAADKAKDYINSAIIAAAKDGSVGTGHGPVAHFFMLVNK